MLVQENTFRDAQKKHSRVKLAYQEKEAVVKEYFRQKNIAFNKYELFLRAFKLDQKLEVWAKEKGNASFMLIHTYDICASSGTVGPKRKEGDYQVPEGVYHINHFNPQSNFHLSLGISYPNASDKILSDRKSPGSAIYIHGNCVTIGCIPITDDKIKELYVMAVEARTNGQEHIPIHVFPTKLDDAGLTRLESQYGNTHHEFWKNLQVVYKAFEETKSLGKVKVLASGTYALN
jgi:murein L,D-transpeptidase YafK